MKKSELRLFKLGSQFRKKYASIDASSLKEEIEKHIQGSVAHASGVKALIPLPFMQMLATDQAALAINVTRDGNTISVSPPGVDPSELDGQRSHTPSQSGFDSHLRYHLLSGNSWLLLSARFILQLQG